MRYLTPEYRSGTGQFGQAVALDHNFVIVGAWLERVNSTQSGAAYVFDVNTGQQLHRLEPDFPVRDSYFGISVAIENGIVAVGSSRGAESGSTVGSVYLFDAASGQRLDILYPKDTTRVLSFGSSVSFDKGLLAVGSPQDQTGSYRGGSVFLFDVNSGEELSKILPNDPSEGALFGCSLDTDRGTLVVGACKDNINGQGFENGAAYVFDLITFQEIAKIIPLDSSPGARFGTSVAIGRDSIIIGAEADDAIGYDSGSAYVFDRDTQAQRYKLTASDGTERQQFGVSVSISDDLVVVGDRLDSEMGENAGAAYIFNASTGAELEKLTAVDGIAGDYFGWSTAINSGKICIGAYGDDNDNKSNNSSGAAYLFNCRADFSRDFNLEFFDISAFVDLFSMHDYRADMNNDGMINFFDVPVFIQLYYEGCP